METHKCDVYASYRISSVRKELLSERDGNWFLFAFIVYVIKYCQEGTSL